MAFTLSRKSLDKLKEVHPHLIAVVGRAITITDLDFCVLEGVRTMERQRELLKAKATTTLKSHHLTGHAVDLAPMLNGTVSWDWPLYHRLASVMQTAAKAEGVVIRWGGVWDRTLDQLSSDMAKEVKDYCARHPGPDFIDGPHFELY